FRTHLLFSSPHLCFSEVQKRAILGWACAIGVTGIPSLYSMKKTYQRIKKLMGDPTEKVTVPSGTTFYMNSVAKIIAMDYSNPLTHLTMQDFPEEGEGKMSQVYHGEKMLHGLPQGLAPPSVKVGSNVYFVDEILQKSNGAYFIPTKFF
ncbi:hypothetical protein M404DRAFT_47010, partial [Pisolithus tinctorius Marx 270]